MENGFILFGVALAKKNQTPWPHKIPPYVFSVIATAYPLPGKLDGRVSACAIY